MARLTREQTNEMRNIMREIEGGLSDLSEAMRPQHYPTNVEGEAYKRIDEGNDALASWFVRNEFQPKPSRGRGY